MRALRAAGGRRGRRTRRTLPPTIRIRMPGDPPRPGRAPLPPVPPPPAEVTLAEPAAGDPGRAETEVSGTELPATLPMPGWRRLPGGSRKGRTPEAAAPGCRPVEPPTAEPAARRRPPWPQATPEATARPRRRSSLRRASSVEADALRRGRIAPPPGRHGAVRVGPRAHAARRAERRSSPRPTAAPQTRATGRGAGRRRRGWRCPGDPAGRGPRHRAGGGRRRTEEPAEPPRSAEAAAAPGPRARPSSSATLAELYFRAGAGGAGDRGVPAGPRRGAGQRGRPGPAGRDRALGRGRGRAAGPAGGRGEDPARRHGPSSGRSRGSRRCSPSCGRR